MNIFYINEDPIIAARELADDHIRKMQIESAQMLSTAYRLNEGIAKIAPSRSGKRMVKHWVLDKNKEDIVYKVAHLNHPSTIWTRQSIQHYRWLVEHGLEICDEFEKRYGKRHKTKDVLEWLQDNEPNIPDNGFVDPPQCMPDEFKEDNTLAAYKRFYILDKVKVKKLDWKKLNNKPEWIK
jgi:hypothetical protein